MSGAKPLRLLYAFTTWKWKTFTVCFCRGCCAISLSYRRSQGNWNDDLWIIQMCSVHWGERFWNSRWTRRYPKSQPRAGGGGRKGVAKKNKLLTTPETPVMTAPSNSAHDTNNWHSSHTFQTSPVWQRSNQANFHTSSQFDLPEGAYLPPGWARSTKLRIVQISFIKIKFYDVPI